MKNPKRNFFRPATWLTLLLVVVMAGCTNGQSTESNSPEDETVEAVQGPILEQVQLDKFQELRKDERVQVLDVRTPGEVAAGRIKGAIAINVHDPNFAQLVQEQLDPQRPVAIYCQSGGRSSRAARELQGLDFVEVYNFIGGVGQWRGAGLPLER